MTEKDLLRRYLGRYNLAQKRLGELKHRRDRIAKEYYPLKSPTLNGMPHGSEPSVGAAAYVYTVSDVTSQIDKQVDLISLYYFDLLSIFCLLPFESEDRSVLELRYIDGMNDRQIMTVKHYSHRSSVSYHLDNALTDLLNFEKVQKKLADYQTEIDSGKERKGNEKN